MRIFWAVAILSFASLLAAQSQPRYSEQMPRSPGQGGKSQPSVHSDGESSSRDTIIDLSPPPNDAAKHPGSSAEGDTDDDSDSDVMEVKKWDPHKAAKNVEVGDYYFKQKNYPAAISRYREALEYKPRDAEATFRLAQVLEKTNESQEAMQRYQEYLKILKNGPFAPEAKKGIERMQQKTQRSSK
jgi:tetratricopeptide (TPR) repeat protein